MTRITSNTAISKIPAQALFCFFKPEQKERSMLFIKLNLDDCLWSSLEAYCAPGECD